MLTSQQLFILLVLAVIGISPAASSEQCTPTPERPIGNSYIPNVAKHKIDVGRGLIMQGRVLSATDCQPIADAIIEHWQAGNQGTYENHLRAFTFSLPDGSYRFETEWPAMTIPHIHFIVTAENHSKLVTQWIPGSKTGEATFDLVLKPALSF
ncbi:MAG: intradiol ring-cleavage dioxygenase [Gammaproteobacteria bacterium]|nr:intradiol ring-cleavage dioxygenase [Gammaproteobacteria bacterium]